MIPQIGYPDAMTCELRRLVAGEFTIGGFRNRDLRDFLPDKSLGQVSRLLKRLRLHGLIKEVGKSYKYYLTKLGPKSRHSRLEATEALHHSRVRTRLIGVTKFRNSSPFSAELQRLTKDPETPTEIVPATVVVPTIALVRPGSEVVPVEEPEKSVVK